MEQDNSSRKGQDGQGRKSSAVHLRIPTLIMAFFLTFVAIATAYLTGVMSGRHSAISTAERNGAPHAAPGQKLDLSNEGRESASSGKRGEPILSAEELEYARVLRRDDNTPLSRLKNTTEKTAASSKPDSVAQDTPPAAATAPRPSLQKTLAEENSGEIADYLFQVGAFKDERTVDSLREKLEGHGLRTMMQREGKLYLVLVRLRGTASRAAELVGLFNELGLGEPMLRSRTPLKP